MLQINEWWSQTFPRIKDRQAPPLHSKRQMCEWVLHAWFDSGEDFWAWKIGTLKDRKRGQNGGGAEQGPKTKMEAQKTSGA